MNTTSPRIVTTIITLLLLVLLNPLARSQEGRQPLKSDSQSGAEKYFTDVELVDQNGQKKRLFSDLMKDHVVIVHSFISTCKGACPVINRNLQEIQKVVGDKLGKSVHILSITVDPLEDTAPRLLEFSRKSQAKSGWYFLTGEKANVDFALKKFGLYVEDKEQHLRILILGNARTGLWKKAFGLAQTEELVKVIESVINDPGQ
ncbi:MAG TPA: SCO family protein [Pyrinomonadaceae bacterium]|jgi:protein SCO1/2|nr:SCO family protein [Pyrinomonadaceae bacterium]